MQTVSKRNSKVLRPMNIAAIYFGVLLGLFFLGVLENRADSEGMGFFPLLVLTTPWSWLLMGIWDLPIWGKSPLGMHLAIFVTCNVLSGAANASILYFLIHRKLKRDLHRREEEMAWEAAYAILADIGNPSDPKTICTAITRLGKPFDAMRVKRAGPLVCRYLHDRDFVVRYQAIWFVGCWGRLSEYLPLIIDCARSDEEIYNRAFAARCAGRVLMSHRDMDAIKVLVQMASDEEEESDVRVAAYSALVYAFYGRDGESRAREFEPIGGKVAADFDLPWLASLPEWVETLYGRTK